VLVLGHPQFYPRFGFRAELAKPLDAPFAKEAGDAWMALELAPGALSCVAGRVVYPPPFGLDDSNA
jgi:putative acetyltransferase